MWIDVLSILWKMWVFGYFCAKKNRRGTFLDRSYKNL